MNEYVNRLVNVGIHISEAYYIVLDFLKEFGINELEEYIADLERTRNVDRI